MIVGKIHFVYNSEKIFLKQFWCDAKRAIQNNQLQTIVQCPTDPPKQLDNALLPLPNNSTMPYCPSQTIGQCPTAPPKQLYNALL